MTKILVCGATGFMGYNIFRALKQNPEYEVHGTGNLEFDIEDTQGIHWLDLRNYEETEKLFKKIRPDIVIQAAATTSGSKDIVSKPYLHVTDNAIMNSIILRLCFEFEVKHFVFLSCGVMYDPSKSPVKESDLRLDDEKISFQYFGVGWTKIYVEKMCQFYAKLGRTKHTCIRHSNTIGPYDKYDLEKSHFFGATVTKVLTAPLNGEINVWGTGEEERDLIHVFDVVDFIKLIIQPEKQKETFEVINISLGKSFSVNSVVDKIIMYSGKNLTVKHDISKPSIPIKLSLDNSLAKEKYGWEPKMTINESIVQIVDWWKEKFETNG